MQTTEVKESYEQSMLMLDFIELTISSILAKLRINSIMLPHIPVNVFPSVVLLRYKMFTDIIIDLAMSSTHKVKNKGFIGFLF